MTPPLLCVEDLRLAFGGVRALDGATFAVRPGTITGLIGPNGAGKTTLFDVVSGFARPDAGRVLFAGRRVDGLPAYMVARRGIGRTFQLIRLMPRMDAVENLMIASGAPGGETLSGAFTGGWRAAEARARREATEALHDVDLGERLEVPAGLLSYGQQKLVEIARVLSRGARLVLLDEPMAGVNPVMRNRILDTLHRLNRDGVTFLIVEHDLPMIMAHCDDVVVMDQGRVIAQGTPAEVANDPRVITAYMGDTDPGAEIRGDPPG